MEGFVFTVILGFICGYATPALAVSPIKPGSSCGPDLQESIYNELFVRQHYNKHFAPISGDGVPLEVNVNMFISDYVFNDALQQLEVNIYLRQTYNDFRLHYQSPAPRCPRFQYLILSTEESIKASAWTPDTSLSGQLSSFKHEVPDRYSQFLRVYPSGQVMTSHFFSLTVPCYKNAQGHPVCKIQPELYSSVTSEVVLRFEKQDAIQIDDNKVNANRYKLVLVGTEESEWQAVTGTFSQLTASFEIVGGSGGWQQPSQHGWSG